MISTHQPKIFATTLKAAVSSRADGDMKFGVIADTEVVRHRQLFLAQVGIALEQSVPMKISYDKDDFTVYHRVGKANQGEGAHDPNAIVADALVTTDPQVALFLPVADCVAAILYDLRKQVLMLAHLGRHSIEQQGGTKSVRYMQTLGSDPADILVWLSPAAGGKNYPLRAFDGRGMQGVVREQLLLAGVDTAHVEVSPIDTTSDDGYFSHSEFLKGEQAADGRFAVVVMMSGQGEPALELS